MTSSSPPLVSEPAQVLAVVLQIIESVTGQPQPGVTAQSAIDTLDSVDSLRLLEIIALSEEHFGVETDTGGFDNIDTVGDIVWLISQKLNF